MSDTVTRESRTGEDQEVMSDTNFQLSTDADLDDLPRTLRREREARQRGASGGPRPMREEDYIPVSDEPIPATVKRLDIPFLRLVAFFLKAVLAAIPALILLGVILWFAGHLLQMYFPQLIKMKILIAFPNG
jgi:hypothetical protein